MKKITLSFLAAVLLICNMLPLTVSAQIIFGANPTAASGRPVISTIHILMYHKITDNKFEIEKNDFCVTPKQFEADIRYIKKKGYKFCFASEVDMVLTGQYPRGNYVAITFDDGYESDFYHAMPVLEKYDAKATIFVVGSRVDTEGHISREHLTAVAKSPRIEIGSHSFELHNKSVSEIQKMYDGGETEAIVKDFNDNADFLEQITGKPVTTLSYPNGIWNNDVDKALRASGFTATFTSDKKRSVVSGIAHGRFNRSMADSLAAILKK